VPSARKNGRRSQGPRYRSGNRPVIAGCAPEQRTAAAAPLAESACCSERERQSPFPSGTACDLSAFLGRSESESGRAHRAKEMHRWSCARRVPCTRARQCACARPPKDARARVRVYPRIYRSSERVHRPPHEAARDTIAGRYTRIHAHVRRLRRLAAGCTGSRHAAVAHRRGKQRREDDEGRTRARTTERASCRRRPFVPAIVLGTFSSEMPTVRPSTLLVVLHRLVLVGLRVSVLGNYLSLFLSVFLFFSHRRPWSNCGR